MPFTDYWGNPLPGITDAFTVTSEYKRPGRTAADKINDAPFGGPKDMEFGILRNRNEIHYFDATSEKPYTVELLDGNGAKVDILMSPDTSESGLPKDHRQD